MASAVSRVQDDSRPRPTCQHKAQVGVVSQEPPVHETRVPQPPPIPQSPVIVVEPSPPPLPSPLPEPKSPDFIKDNTMVSHSKGNEGKKKKKESESRGLQKIIQESIKVALLDGNSSGRSSKRQRKQKVLFDL